MYKSNLLAQVVACSLILGVVGAVMLEVREGNSTCIKANLSATLSITYNTSNASTTVQVDLPDSTTVDAGSSSCGGGGRQVLLVGVFGPGHSIGLFFSTNGSLYSVDMLSLQYNLSDSSLFPLANSSDVVTVMTSSVGMWAWLNTTYRCVSPTSIPVGGAVVTFSGVRMEAYMAQQDLSPVESVCAADLVSTTPAPAPAPTTAVPAPTPQGSPEQGNYFVTTDNGTVCLMARMGLQLNVSYTSRSQNKTIQEVVNINPNLTLSAGMCGPNISTLVLAQERNTNLSFTFTLNTTSNKYHLSGLMLAADWPDMSDPVSLSNSNLSYLAGSWGRSYSCNSELTLVVAEAFSINTFRLQVQPFAVTNSQFATVGGTSHGPVFLNVIGKDHTSWTISWVPSRKLTFDQESAQELRSQNMETMLWSYLTEECQVDQDQMLIPIVVGAALAGLVLVVLIAYLIGRKRSNAGYQTI